LDKASAISMTLNEEKGTVQKLCSLIKITQNIQQRITESSSSLQISNILMEASQKFGPDVANMTIPDFR